MRVPFIIAVPNGKGQHTSRLVEDLDLYATLAELCDLPKPKDIEGRSLEPLLKNPNAKWDYPAYSMTAYRNSLGRSVRMGRWHYVEWDEGKSGTILTDLENDPKELKNLAQDPKYAKTVEDMRKLLKQMP